MLKDVVKRLQGTGQKVGSSGLSSGPLEQLPPQHASQQWLLSESRPSGYSSILGMGTISSAYVRAKRKRQPSSHHFTTNICDPIGRTVAEINALGNRTTTVYDADGDQPIVEEPGGDRTTTSWDYENQPILIVHPDGSRITTTYNADDRRVQVAE